MYMLQTNKEKQKLLDELSIQLIRKAGRERRETWYAEHAEKGKAIIKLVPFQKSLVRRFARELLGSSLMKEAQIYQSLNLHTFSFFKTANVIASDGRKYLLLDYIDGERGWNRNLASNRIIAAAIYEFNRSSIRWRQNPIRSGFLRIWNNFSFIIVRDSWRLYLRGVIKSKELCKCIKICWSENRKQDKLIPHLLHNDFYGPNNIITGPDGKPFFFDFENMRKEKKWLLGDVIELAFDKDSLHELKINTGLIMEYMKLYRAEHEDAIQITSPARIILLARVLRIMLYKTKSITERDKTSALMFLKEILLDGTCFHHWIDDVGLVDL